ncbi:allantoate amidohydrolase [Streptomyces sp. NPDC001920]
MTTNLVAPTAAPDVPALSVDAARLLGRIEKFAAIGRNAAGGIDREGFSDADIEARLELVHEAEAAGLAARVDAAGNVIVRRTEGRCTERPTLLIGSHLDTVVNGGRLDGTYGVLAALEVLQTVVEAGVEPAHEPVAVAFANEEGARFAQPFWGSKALVGRLAELPLEPLAHDGSPLREPLARLGGDLDALDSAVWPKGSIAAYLELHVEQGPVLERGGDRIGVVTGITGRTVLTVTVRGEAGHAGTTPMEMRRDPLTGAARILLAVEGLAKEQQLCRVATVGRLDIRPNSPNTIAQEVQLTVDLRDGNPVRLGLAEQAVRNLVDTVAQERGLGVEVAVSTRTEPAQADRVLRDAIADSAAELGHPYQLLPSGAGHDAQVVAGIAPIGMIFVPSLGGVSHVPEEDTADSDLIAGADVLLRTALRL